MKTAKKKTKIKKRTRQPKKRAMNQLEKDTAAYFDDMSEEDAKAERELEAALAGASRGIDFDKDP